MGSPTLCGQISRYIHQCLITKKEKYKYQITLYNLNNVAVTS